ncbi:MAG: SIS domain-containing protein, partial [Candidatus Thermoplasmatota archaeon]|nr:SIS domain-containing protein [Candidatus Thermoplasmatota archaeon]
MVQAKVLTGEVIAKLDPSGMYEAVLSSPTSFERHLSPLTFSMPPFQRLVVAGMGGSAIAGDVFGAVLEQLGAPVETVVRRSHSIPPWVGEETAIIASSYSGNTKETLAVVHSALERGLTAIALTSGGKLMEVAQENGLPLLKLPPGLQPRAAFPNAIGVLLSLAASAYDLPSLFSWCSQTADELKMLGEKLSFDAPNNPAMEIANHLGDAMPVFYGGGCLSPVARRAAAQFNENGKRLSFHGEFPEMEHNDIVGWACGPCNMKPI